MRVRKNAALLTADEWERYCRAVVALKHTFAAGSDTSVYDQFVALHWGAVSLTDGADPPTTINAAHKGSAFLPWHREFLRRYEEALVAVDPRVSLPYWNWGLGAQHETDDLFQERRLGATSTGEIMSGYFSVAGYEDVGSWEIHAALDRRNGKKSLQRGSPRGKTLPSETEVLNALSLNSFNGFCDRLEGLHNRGHLWVGGHMLPSTSPNDPIFFMHHAQVDRIWALWQRKHSGAANYTGSSRGHGLNDNMWPWDGGALKPRETAVESLIPTLASSDLVKPVDVLDTRELGYIYDGEDARWELGKTGESVDHNWSTVSLGSRYGRNIVVVASLQSFVGPDTAAVRVRSRAGDPNVDFMVEEEQSRDTELGHAKEAVGYLAGEEGLIHDRSGKIVVGEMGAVGVRQWKRDLWETVVFKHSYKNPVVIATISSYFGDHPSHVRMRDVTGTSFSLCIEEWQYLDDYHTTEDISYLVVEAGDHRLADGTLINAGRTAATHEWQAVAFESPFADVPVVLSHCMTHEGRDPVVTRQRDVRSSDFKVRLQEEEALDPGGHPREEVIGYIAFGRE